MAPSIMEYLKEAFSTGQISFIIFTQAFNERSSDEIHQFYLDLAAETEDERNGFLSVVSSVGFTLPPDPEA